MSMPPLSQGDQVRTASEVRPGCFANASGRVLAVHDGDPESLAFIDHGYPRGRKLYRLSEIAKVVEHGELGRLRHLADGVRAFRDSMAEPLVLPDSVGVAMSEMLERVAQLDPFIQGLQDGLARRQK